MFRVTKLVQFDADPNLVTLKVKEALSPKRRKKLIILNEVRTPQAII